MNVFLNGYSAELESKKKQDLFFIYFYLTFTFIFLILISCMYIIYYFCCQQWNQNNGKIAPFLQKKKTVTLKMSIFNYSQNKKVQRKKVISNQQPAVFIVFVQKITSYQLYMQLYIYIYIYNIYIYICVYIYIYIANLLQNNYNLFTDNCQVRF